MRLRDRLPELREEIHRFGCPVDVVTEAGLRGPFHAAALREAIGV